jgi:acyl carrier protein
MGRARMNDDFATTDDDVMRGVAAIWKSELGVEELTPEDNFFALGGDSVGMLNMLFKIQQVFGFEFAPATVFENPSLSAFSLVVSLAVDNRPAQGGRIAVDSDGSRSG